MYNTALLRLSAPSSIAGSRMVAGTSESLLEYSCIFKVLRCACFLCYGSRSRSLFSGIFPSVSVTSLQSNSSLKYKPIKNSGLPTFKKQGLGAKS